MKERPTTATRLLPLGYDTFSVGVSKYQQPLTVFDMAQPKNSFVPLQKISRILYSHHHGDHFPTNNVKDGTSETLELLRDTPLYLDETSLLLLNHIGIPIEESHLQINCYDENPYNPLFFEDSGYVWSFPVSHSLDARGFFYASQDFNSTAVIVPDSRDGSRTNKAVQIINEIKTQLQIDQVDLFIGDASNYKKETLTIDQHLLNIRRGLTFAFSENLPTVMLIKPGDYGVLTLWLRQQEYAATFEQAARDTNTVHKDLSFMFEPKLADLLRNPRIGIADILSVRNDFSVTSYDPNAVWMHPKQHSIFIIDDFYKNPLKNQEHVLITESRKQAPYNRPEATIATFHAGLTGHSSDAYEQLYAAANPRNHAESHPRRGHNNKYHPNKMVLQQKGYSHDF